jgi:hypothetical protein
MQIIMPAISVQSLKTNQKKHCEERPSKDCPLSRNKKPYANALAVEEKKTNTLTNSKTRATLNISTEVETPNNNNKQTHPLIVAMPITTDAKTVEKNANNTACKEPHKQWQTPKIPQQKTRTIKSFPVQ